MGNCTIVGITDGGGRGDALAEAYSEHHLTGTILAVPGNDLMQRNIRLDVGFMRISAALQSENAKNIADIFARNSVDHVDVCQDDMVYGDLVTELQQRGVPSIGPTKQAGKLEWDKAWARAFMKKYEIPHPSFNVFSSEEEGRAFLRSQSDQPWAIKASGLALGKGVILAKDTGEAIDAVSKMKSFGDAGKTFLIEQYLEGEEFSAFAASDGSHFQIIGTAQDHKRLNDGDEGPNTGGMGCSSSPLIVTPDILKQVEQIFAKTFDGMAKELCPYRGILYLGGMVVDGKVFVIEYNSRWGDPEAQVIVPGLQNFHELSEAILSRRIDQFRLETDGKIRVAVALAARGYPDSPVKGKEIFGIEDARRQRGVTVYGAGVRREEGHDFTNGGRLLYVVGEGSDTLEAQSLAYDAIDRIHVADDAGHYRRDIGDRNILRPNSEG